MPTNKIRLIPYQKSLPHSMDGCLTTGLLPHTQLDTTSSVHIILFHSIQNSFDNNESMNVNDPPGSLTNAYRPDSTILIESYQPQIEKRLQDIMIRISGGENGETKEWQRFEEAD